MEEPHSLDKTEVLTMMLLKSQISARLVQTDWSRLADCRSGQPDPAVPAIVLWYSLRFRL